MVIASHFPQLKFAFSSLLNHPSFDSSFACYEATLRNAVPVFKSRFHDRTNTCSFLKAFSSRLVIKLSSIKQLLQIITHRSKWLVGKIAVRT